MCVFLEVKSLCDVLLYFAVPLDEFLPETHIQNFLSRTFFFDEFQRVFEDEKFRSAHAYIAVW